MCLAKMFGSKVNLSRNLNLFVLWKEIPGGRENKHRKCRLFIAYPHLNWASDIDAVRRTHKQLNITSLRKVTICAGVGEKTVHTNH